MNRDTDSTNSGNNAKLPLTLIKASAARKMATSTTNDVFDEVMRNINDRIRAEAKKGKCSLFGPFDMPRGASYGLSIPEEVRAACIKELEAAGYKYTYTAASDPGHPCDRPTERLDW